MDPVDVDGAEYYNKIVTVCALSNKQYTYTRVPHKDTEKIKKEKETCPHQKAGYNCKGKGHKKKKTSATTSQSRNRGVGASTRPLIIIITLVYKKVYFPSRVVVKSKEFDRRKYIFYTVLTYRSSLHHYTQIY